MANEIDVTPVTVDYTDKDYYSLRDALVSRVINRIPEWTGTDPNDFGLALIEAFSYMGDVISYYIDRAANEMSLQTASQRSSIMNLARMYGYTPSGYQSANVDVAFTNSSGVDITLPVGTQLAGQYLNGDTLINVIFETAEEAVVPANGSVAGITAYHGENVSWLYPTEGGLAGELVGSSNGTPNQSFRLLENQVVDGSVQVFVQRNGTYEEWSHIDRLTDAGASDSVFTTYLDADNFVYVVFGDSVSGRIPVTHAQIKAQYVKGGGSLGRIPSNTLTYINHIPNVSDISSIASKITISQADPATGGLDPETSDIIRQVAPFALTAFDRAVTLDDYANLCLNSTVVGKANATAESFTSVTVYLAPAAENSPQDPFPGYKATTYLAEWAAGTPEDALNDLQWENTYAAGVAELSDKTQIGVSYTISPVVYVPLTLTVKYSKFDQYTDAQVQTSIRGVLETQYGYNQLSFAQTLYPEDVEYQLKLVPGVKNVTVAAMYRTGEIASRVPVIASANEVFAILPYNEDLTTIASVVSTTPVTGIAKSASGTLTFAPGTYAYAFSTSSTSTTVTVTAATSPFITITQGSTTTQLLSGIASTSLSLATGVNTLVINALADDHVTTYTYTLTITRT
jgi:hypothetical protein